MESSSSAHCSAPLVEKCMPLVPLNFFNLKSKITNSIFLYINLRKLKTLLVLVEDLSALREHLIQLNGSYETAVV